MLRYVYLNEHKDRAARGELVRGFDPYSSHRWFDGWAQRRQLGRPPPPGPDDPVTLPCSWLLRIGWLRHGPIRDVWLEAMA